MYFIVVGHMFPDGYKSIYAFSVPLFFVVSGLLSKNVSDSKIFWRKIVQSLIVPMICFCLLSLAVFLLKERNLSLIYPSELAKWTVQIMAGFQGGVITSLPGLNVCWFIYSLAIIKTVFNFCPIKIQYVLIAPCCILTSVIWHSIGFSIPLAWTDAVLAYPFFLFGYFLKRYMSEFDNLNINRLCGWLFVVLSMGILIVIPHFNNWPMMYQNQYGNNYFLFITGASAGIYLVYFISRQLGRIAKKYITVLSVGNILTLGIHPYFVQFYSHFHLTYLWSALLVGLLIMAMMYPIINFAQKYFPVIIGRSYRPLTQ